VNAGGLAVALLFGLGPTRVEVVGDSACPTAAAVTSRLAALTPSSNLAVEPEAANRVTLARGADALELALVDPRGARLAAKTLAASGTCDELAAAAAVVVAAWQADLNPDLTPGVTLPEERAPSAMPSLVVAAPPVALAGRATSFGVGLGLLASDAGGAVAPGASLQGWIGLGTRGLGVGATLSGTTSRSAAVGQLPAAASWTRTTLGVGPNVVVGHSSVRVEAHAQALAALLHVRGVGITNAASDTTPELGAAVGGKLEGITGTSVVWVGVDALAWPGQQRLLIENLPGDGRLSRFEVTASLGVGFGRFP
jgi:hypothetical protein